jgi:hypothetical protein
MLPILRSPGPIRNTKTKQDFRAIDLDLDDGSTNVAEVLHRPAWQIEAGFESSPLMVTF